MTHRLGYDTQCEICGKACMFDDVNDEGECAYCRGISAIQCFGNAVIKYTLKDGEIHTQHIPIDEFLAPPPPNHGESECQRKAK